MTSSNQTKNNLVAILQEFATQYINQYQKTHQHLPIIEHDKEWPSPCELPQKEKSAVGKCYLSAGEVFWQPMPILIEKNFAINFENVESALEISLHPDIKSYFTTLFSESLDASCEEGDLSLLFAWNEADFQRLQENLIGHILMKRRLKQTETIFFAVTDEEDMIISLDNSTGTVWVERVGCKPHKQLSASLTDFIRMLKVRVN